MNTTITATNSFHNTSATFSTRNDGTISAATYRRVRRELCGVAGCQCNISRKISDAEPVIENGKVVAYRLTSGVA